MKKILTLFSAVFISFSSLAASMPDIGEVAPDYLGRGNDGNVVRVSEQQGKIMVVTFWASWCPPCLKELPLLEGLQATVGTEQLKVVAVNYREDKKQYRRIKNKLKNLTFTLTSDSNGKIGRRYGVDGIPHMVLIDHAGKIANRWVGYGEGNIQQVVDAMNELLAKQLAEREP